ncbi:hypothetical protein Tco_0475683 [Tanacetum coccineum]
MKGSNSNRIIPKECSSNHIKKVHFGRFISEGSDQGSYQKFGSKYQKVHIKGSYQSFISKVQRLGLLKPRAEQITYSHKVVHRWIRPDVPEANEVYCTHSLFTNHIIKSEETDSLGCIHTLPAKQITEAQALVARNGDDVFLGDAPIIVLREYAPMGNGDDVFLGDAPIIVLRE